MRIHKSTLVIALLCSASIVSAKSLFTGAYASGNLLYISSDVESSDTEIIVNTNTTNVYTNKSSASGVGQGASVGYRVGMNNRFVLGASFTGFTAQVDQLETREQTLGGVAQPTPRSQELKLNHTMYPYLEAGFSPSDETLIIAKVGYGQENWDISLSTSAGPTITSSSDIKGLIAGAEITTLVRDKIAFSLSVNYSDLETINLSNTADNNNSLSIALTPKTLSASISIGYIPNGMIF